MQNSVVEVIQQFHTAQIDSGKSELTAKTYSREIAKFAEWLRDSDGDIMNPTRHDVQSYITSLTDKASAVTIDKVYAALSVYANWLQRPDVVQDIRKPEVHKQRNIAPKSLERNDRNRLLRDVERSGNLRDIAIVYTLLHCGLRVHEATSLNREDIIMSERKGELTVRHGKGNIARVVPLSREVRHHLTRYLAERKDNRPELFLSREGHRISDRAVQHMLKGYGVHPHMLRHTFCRDLVSSGIDITTVADLAGHSDINVTKRYSKPSRAELEQAIDRVFS